MPPDYAAKDAEIARLREALEWCEGVSSEVADPQLSLDQARVLAVSIRIRARKALEGK